MSVGAIVDALSGAWQYAPLPFLFLFVVLGGYVWLWIESRLTRVGRAMPGWRRPWPLLPEVSYVSIWLIRLSWLLLLAWIVLFVVLAINTWAMRSMPSYPPSLSRGILSAGETWHRGYSFLTGIFPRTPERGPMR